MMQVEPIAYVRTARAQAEDDYWGGVESRLELTDAVEPDERHIRVHPVLGRSGAFPPCHAGEPSMAFFGQRKDVTNCRAQRFL